MAQKQMFRALFCTLQTERKQKPFEQFENTLATIPLWFERNSHYGVKTIMIITHDTI